MQPKQISKAQFVDYSILIPYLILSLLGLVVVFSSTVSYQLDKGASPYRLVITQSAFFILSLFAIWMIFRMKTKALRSTGFVSIFIPIEIILLVYARFLAPTVNGAHGWISIPGAGTLQPAEYLKIFVVWYLANVFSSKQEDIEKQDLTALFPKTGFWQNVTSGWRGLLLVMTGFVIIMPDMGNALMIILIGLIMIASSGIASIWTRVYGALGVIAAFLVLGYANLVHGHIIPNNLPIAYINKRFIAYLDPFKNVSDEGHQIANGYYAISNGGWLGRGLGNSIEKKGYLPEAHTDFIFTIVIEELGLIGAIIILAILFFLIIRMISVGLRAKSAFNAMIAYGVAGMFVIQVFINLGGVIGIIPSTGVTFPFLSQGGNSLLILSLGVGFVLNVSAEEKRNQLVELNKYYQYERSK